MHEAHDQLNKYQRYIQSNRGLILKTFAVLFFFIILYGTVYR